MSKSPSSLPRFDANASRRPSGDTRGWISSSCDCVSRSGMRLSIATSGSIAKRSHCVVSEARWANTMRPSGVHDGHRSSPSSTRARARGVAAVRADDVEIEAVAAVGGEGDALAVGRPRRLTLHAGCLGELSSRPAHPAASSRCDRARRRARRLPSGDQAGSRMPGGPVCARGLSVEDRDECEDDVEAGLQTRLDTAPSGPPAFGHRFDDVTRGDAVVVEQLFGRAAARNLARPRDDGRRSRGRRPPPRPRRRCRRPT